MTFKHKNLCPFLGIFFELKIPHFIFESDPKGCLRFFLKTCRYELTEKIKNSFALDLAEGMNFLHKKNLIHGNLNSFFCFLHSNWTVKISNWVGENLNGKNHFEESNKKFPIFNSNSDSERTIKIDNWVDANLFQQPYKFSINPDPGHNLLKQPYRLSINPDPGFNNLQQPYNFSINPDPGPNLLQQPHRFSINPDPGLNNLQQPYNFSINPDPGPNLLQQPYNFSINPDPGPNLLQQPYNFSINPDPGPNLLQQPYNFSINPDPGPNLLQQPYNFSINPDPGPNLMSEDDYERLFFCDPELLTNWRKNEKQNHQILSFRAKKFWQKKDERNFFEKHHDVYSFGILLIEIYTREPPFQQFSSTLSLQEILNGLKAQTLKIQSNSNFPDFIWNLIQICCSKKKSERPNFCEILNQMKKNGINRNSIVDSIEKSIEFYAANLEDQIFDRTNELQKMATKMENLLLQILPGPIAKKLENNEIIEPEDFDQVSIYFSDVVGFTSICSESSPLEIVNLLNTLYTMFDSTIEKFDVYKVETIGEFKIWATDLIFFYM